MAVIIFYARYEDAAGDGSNGLTVVWDVERITRADGTRITLVTGGATSVTVGRRGLYGYVLSGADLTLYDYVATAITASATPTVHEVAAVWTLWALSWHDVLTAALTAAGSIGKLFVDTLDAAISTVATAIAALNDITAASVWSYATRTTTSSSSAPGTGLDAEVWTVIRGDTLTKTFSTIADDATITKVQLTVKDEPNAQPDTAALLWVDSEDDLVRLSGAAPAATYTGTFDTDGALAVTAATMSQLGYGRFYYDVQVWRGVPVQTIEEGIMVVTADKGRSVTPA